MTIPVLEVYRRDFAEDEVLVCMDETSKQHVKETRTPVPTRPGETTKYDYDYERNGVSNLFMLCAPLAGWRHVKATDRRLADRHILKRELDAWQNSATKNQYTSPDDSRPMMHASN